MAPVDDASATAQVPFTDPHLLRQLSLGGNADRIALALSYPNIETLQGRESCALMEDFDPAKGDRLARLWCAPIVIVRCKTQTAQRVTERAAFEAALAAVVDNSKYLRRPPHCNFR